MLDEVRELLQSEDLLDHELVLGVEEYNELPIEAARINIECEFEERNRSTIVYQRVQEAIEDSEEFVVELGRLPCRGNESRNPGFVAVVSAHHLPSSSEADRQATDEE